MGASAGKYRRLPKATTKSAPSSGKQKRERLAVTRQIRRKKSADQCRDHEIQTGEVILADLSQQAKNNSYDPPQEYRDYQFTCRDCGRVEIWTARQQQWWYEVAKGAIYSHAIRCRACRRKHRQANGSAGASAED